MLCRWPGGGQALFIRVVLHPVVKLPPRSDPYINPAAYCFAKATAGVAQDIMDVALQLQPRLTQEEVVTVTSAASHWTAKFPGSDHPSYGPGHELADAFLVMATVGQLPWVPASVV